MTDLKETWFETYKEYAIHTMKDSITKEKFLEAWIDRTEYLVSSWKNEESIRKQYKDFNLYLAYHIDMYQRLNENYQRGMEIAVSNPDKTRRWL